MVTSHQNITSIPLQQNQNLGENKTRPETITVGEKLCIIGLNFVLLYFSALLSRSVHHCIRGNCRVAFLSALNAMFGSCCHFLGTCDCWCGRCCSGAGRKIPERERGKAKKRKELWRNGKMEKGVALTLDGLLFYPSWSFPSSLSLPPGKDCQCHYWRWKIPSEMEVLLYTAKTIASMPIYIAREG